MIEIAMSIIVVLAGAVAARFATGDLSRNERVVITISLLAHVLAAVAQILIARTLYGGGDNIYYITDGGHLARAMEIDFERYGRFWLALLFQQTDEEVLPVIGIGSPTGSMVAIAAGLTLILRYSYYAVSLTVALATLLSKVALYRVFRELLPAYAHRRVLAAVFLMPSFVFWSSGMQKEAIVVAGLGPAWLGIHRFIQGRTTIGVTLATLGVVPVALVKPYTLFVLVIAGGIWFAAAHLRAQKRRSERVSVRPIYVLVAVVAVYGAVVMLGRLFPAYSVDKLGEGLAQHQSVGVMLTENSRTRGGGDSAYSMGDAKAQGIQQQLAYAPLAAATALFRPLPFEANNGLALIASLEVLVLTISLLQALTRRGVRGFFRAIFGTPVFLGSMAFAVMLGMGVGLATTNFGSLSRYRMPLIPLYSTVVLVLALRVPAQARQRTGQVRGSAAGSPRRSRLTARSVRHAG